MIYDKVGARMIGGLPASSNTPVMYVVAGLSSYMSFSPVTSSLWIISSTHQADNICTIRLCTLDGS